MAKCRIILLTLTIMWASASNTNQFFALFEQATQLLQQDEYHQAYELYKKASELQPNCPQIYFNMGIVLQILGNIPHAIQQHKKAVALKPDYIKALLQLGTCLKDTGRLDEAVSAFYAVLDSQADNTIAHHAIAQIYYDTGKFTHALYHFKMAITHGDNINIVNDYAGLLTLVNHNNKAVTLYKDMLQQHPNSAELYYNIGNALKRQNKLDKALPFYQKAIALHPDSTFLQFGIGLAYLTAGDFIRGWEKYEYRWGAHNIPKPTFTKPMWDGSPAARGETLFLYAEQGLGDTFQFIRYAEVAKQMGATVIVAVQKPLVKILSLCPYIDAVIDQSQAPAPFDFHCPLLSMPYLCKTTRATIPCNIPYLHADPTLVAYWKEKLSLHNTNKQTNTTNTTALSTKPKISTHNATAAKKQIPIKIGICWQGNQNFKTKVLEYIFESRQIPLHCFEPLLNLENATVYSLQKTVGEDQISTLSNPHKLHLFDSNFDNIHGRFMDTAAVIKNLDLVITVDTSIAHLAGGLGIPVWVLVPQPGDWRWMVDIDYSPWHPTMRLFRQTIPGNWEHVIENIIQALQTILDKKGNS